MKVNVRNDKCIGCGSCVSLTDEKIFDFNDDGLAFAKVENIKDEDQDIVAKAIEYCPTNAIAEVNDGE